MTVYGVNATKPGRALVEKYFEKPEEAKTFKRTYQLLGYDVDIYEYEIRKHRSSLLNLLNRQGCLRFKGVVIE